MRFECLDCGAHAPGRKCTTCGSRNVRFLAFSDLEVAPRRSRAEEEPPPKRPKPDERTPKSTL